MINLVFFSYKKLKLILFTKEDFKKIKLIRYNKLLFHKTKRPNKQ